MPTNPLTAAGLAVREIRTGARDGVRTKIAIARRTYSTDRADLWDALTDPERIPRWFLPVSGELVVGGRYQTEGNAGGLVERCTAPESFAVTWEYGEMVSWLEITLTPDGTGTTAGTTLQLAHEAPVDPDMWQQFGPGAVGVGWDLGLWGLGLHLETGAPVDPEIGAGYPLTAEGLGFVQQSAHGWAEAAVADGDDPTEAHEAALRTVGFYTTQPEA